MNGQNISKLYNTLLHADFFFQNKTSHKFVLIFCWEEIYGFLIVTLLKSTKNMYNCQEDRSQIGLIRMQQFVKTIR